MNLEDFKFKLNPEKINGEPEDFEIIFSAEKIDDKLYVIHWDEGTEKYGFVDYFIEKVEKYIEDGRWLVLD